MTDIAYPFGWINTCPDQFGSQEYIFTHSKMFMTTKQFLLRARYSIIALLLLSSTALAQEPRGPKTGIPNCIDSLIQEKFDAKNNPSDMGKGTSFEFNPLSRFAKDLWIQAAAPFQMNTEQRYWVGGCALATAVLLLTDQGTYNTIKDAEFDTRWIGKVSPVITQFGSNYGLATLGLFASYSFLADDSKGKETAYLATEAYLTSSVWGVTAKWLTGRERPSAMSETGGEWAGPFAYFRKDKTQSIASFDAFPSGHTWTAFSIATVFAEQYSDHRMVPIVCYTVASLVGISRISQDAHWASDVFVGAILGYLTAEEVVANNPSEMSRKYSASKSNHMTWSLGMLYNKPVFNFQVLF